MSKRRPRLSPAYVGGVDVLSFGEREKEEEELRFLSLRGVLLPLMPGVLSVALALCSLSPEILSLILTLFLRKWLFRISSFRQRSANCRGPRRVAVLSAFNLRCLSCVFLFL